MSYVDPTVDPENINPNLDEHEQDLIDLQAAVEEEQTSTDV